MSVQYKSPQEQTLYQADSNTTSNMRAIRDQLHQVCRQHVNHLVRVETLDGDVFEGAIVGCANGVLYLRQHSEGVASRFTPYSSAAILTLVLFELLVITLLI